MREARFRSLIRFLIFAGFMLYGLGVFFFLSKMGKPGVITMFCGLCVHILAHGADWLTGLLQPWKRHEDKTDVISDGIKGRNPVSS